MLFLVEDVISYLLHIPTGYREGAISALPLKAFVTVDGMSNEMGRYALDLLYQRWK